MRPYTACELQHIIDVAFKLGLRSGRTLAKDVEVEPPRLIELVNHPLDPPLSLRPTPKSQKA